MEVIIAGLNAIPLNHARPADPSAQSATVHDGHVRAAPLMGLPELLRELGQDPAAVFAQAGFDPGLLGDPENAVSFNAGGRLLATCVSVTDCPHFGLLLGERTGPECLGQIGELVAHSPDLGQALRNVVRHLHLHDRGAVPTLSVGEGLARFGYTVYQPGVAATAQIYDLAAAITCNLVRALCSPGWVPEAVLLSHAAPADLLVYRRVFRVRPRFDAEQTAVVFPAALLGRRLPDANPLRYRELEAQIAALAASTHSDLAAKVRRVTCNLLLGGEGSLESVAEHFSLHPRTLNRRLEGQGTSYRKLREECRQALAGQFLRDTDLPVAEIAARLVYADSAAFTHAFRRWNGCTPSAWRANQRTRVQAATAPSVAN
ncbi:MAG TPA: AraC family transcriptional regulator [Lamprocystis sp. (in: g-proteobacteria)]|nr:AraC family transcriptional regulator [Lamprocystis sp. (in: g-proteobacteria)]